MSPLILRPELREANDSAKRKIDPARLTEIQIRCRAAQAYLAGKQRESRPPFEDVWTLIYQDIPTLIEELKDAG